MLNLHPQPGVRPDLAALQRPFVLETPERARQRLAPSVRSAIVCSLRVSEYQTFAGSFPLQAAGNFSFAAPAGCGSVLGCRIALAADAFFEHSSYHWFNFC